MIYQLGMSIHIPGKRADYYEIATKELLPLWARLGMKEVFSFYTYTGNMNGVYTMFAFDDLAALQKSRDVQQKDKALQSINARLNALRVSSTTTLLESNPWSQLENWKQGEKNAIYQFGRVVLIPGKMAEWAAGSKDSAAIYANVGMKWVGSWHGYTGNMNEMYNLFAYKDLAEFEKLRMARLQNPAVQKLSAGHTPLMISQEIVLLEPNPWSPMK
jgi:hypothetical protein